MSKRSVDVLVMESDLKNLGIDNSDDFTFHVIVRLQEQEILQACDIGSVFVVGERDKGKTSLISQLLYAKVGFVQTGMATPFPVYISTIPNGKLDIKRFTMKIPGGLKACADHKARVSEGEPCRFCSKKEQRKTTTNSSEIADMMGEANIHMGTPSYSVKTELKIESRNCIAMRVVDTPGPDGGLLTEETAPLYKMISPEANPQRPLVLIVVNATNGDFTSSSLINPVFNCATNASIIIVITKIDRIKKPEDRTRVLQSADRLSSTYADKKRTPPRYAFVSCSHADDQAEPDFSVAEQDEEAIISEWKNMLKSYESTRRGYKSEFIFGTKELRQCLQMHTLESLGPKGFSAADMKIQTKIGTLSKRIEAISIVHRPESMPNLWTGFSRNTSIEKTKLYMQLEDTIHSRMRSMCEEAIKQFGPVPAAQTVTKIRACVLKTEEIQIERLQWVHNTITRLLDHVAAKSSIMLSEVLKQIDYYVQKSWTEFLDIKPLAIWLERVWNNYKTENTLMWTREMTKIISSYAYHITVDKTLMLKLTTWENSEIEKTDPSLFAMLQNIAFLCVQSIIHQLAGATILQNFQQFGAKAANSKGAIQDGTQQELETCQSELADMTNLLHDFHKIDVSKLSFSSADEKPPAKKAKKESKKDKEPQEDNNNNNEEDVPAQTITGYFSGWWKTEKSEERE